MALLEMNFQGKKISIIGAVRSGIGAAKLAKKIGAIPFVSDFSSEEKIADVIEQLENDNIEYECGGHTERVYDCDFIVTSPGVPTKSSVIQKALELGITIISELEFASYFCKGKIIAITGSNGKTTTTSLTNHIINNSGKVSYAAGNIGWAFSEICYDVKENEFVVLETSSFQLDWNKEFKPYISAILNITPDHLDRYNGFDEYRDAKLSIYKNQIFDNYHIVNFDDKFSQRDIENKNVNVIYFSIKEELNNGIYLTGSNEIIYKQQGKEIFTCRVTDLSIKGLHNVANSMVAIVISKLIGCENSEIIKALSSFKGVEHRLEFVKEINGVKYINDSKATNVDSVWYALQSFDTPIFLILGGIDKGNDYNQIKNLVLEKVKKIYAIGKSADKVFNFFHHDTKVEIKETLQDCIYTANSEAREGEVVLLSPACASMDMFDNYEHRGNVFKEAVNSL